MEDTFKFELGIGRYPWASGDITIEVTIPADMHDSVADSIGTAWISNTNGCTGIPGRPS